MCSYHGRFTSTSVGVNVGRRGIVFSLCTLIWCLKVARNIFELGLKKYIHEPAYVLEYVQIAVNGSPDFEDVNL